MFYVQSSALNHQQVWPGIRYLSGHKIPHTTLICKARDAQVKHLQKKGKINPKLLALAGYGPNQPAASNNTQKGRKLNRRIEIALVPMEMDRPTTSEKKTPAK